VLSRRDDGAAAVEFALVSLPLFALLFGIIQYGFLLFEVQGAATTVKDAARWASRGILDCGDWQARAQDRAEANGVPADPPPTLTAAFDYQDAGPDVVTVTLTFTPRHLVPLVPVPDTITRQAQLDVEYLPPDGLSAC
jgi:hypothetical protein